ncbi:MAG TPA: hypothetical protein DD417_09395 [Elusimicrobia bacterium]|nr:hypothetical protein [Elusimicrobiota bacterium]
MEKSSVESIVRALNDAPARYLIAGGLAVVAHGYVRFTADLDLILDLEESSLRRALAALAGLGYRPRAPVPIEDFADRAKRESWVREKGLKVFSLSSPQHPATEIDVFVEVPFDFGTAYAAASRQDLAPGVSALFVGLADLLRMKRAAGRKPCAGSAAMADGASQWERGWEGHERAQRARLARLTLAEKLAWLEQAQRLAAALGRSSSGKQVKGPPS